MVVEEGLVRDLNEIFVTGQTTVLSFGGASVAQVIKMMDFQGEDHLDTLIMLGTNDVSRVPVTPEGKWKPLLVCLLNEIKEKYRPRLVVLCTIPQNLEVGTPVADFMNGNVTRWNDLTRSLVRSNPSELRLLDLEITLRMTDHLALTRDGIHFNTLPGRRRINDVFQTQIEEMEQELRTTDSLARTSSTGGGRVRGNGPEPLANRLGPLAIETGATPPVDSSLDVREKLGTAPPTRRQTLESRLGRPIDQSQTSSQTISRTSNPPATAIPASTGSPSTSATSAEGIEPSSVLLWNRPDPSGLGHCVNEFEHEHIAMSSGCMEDDGWRRSHSVRIISNTGRGLGVIGTVTV